MGAETRVHIVTTTCHRCDWLFRYIHKPGPGRARYYCEVCRVLEAMDANDARPRRTAQVRRVGSRPVVLADPPEAFHANPA